MTDEQFVRFVFPNVQKRWTYPHSDYVVIRAHVKRLGGWTKFAVSYGESKAWKDAADHIKSHILKNHPVIDYILSPSPSTV